MALYIVVFLWVFWFKVWFFALLHTKETAAAQYFKGAPAIPHRQTTFPWSMLCCAALCYRQTRAVMEKRRPGLLIKNTTVSSTDYTAMGKLHREDTLPTSTAERCSVTWLDLSNKAYNWRSLKTSVRQKKWQNIFNENDWQVVYREISLKWCLEFLFAFLWGLLTFSLLLQHTPGQDPFTNPTGLKARGVNGPLYTRCCI